MNDFERKLAWGGQAERALSLWLQQQGWYVLPTYDYSGLDNNKAPKLEGSSPNRSLVIPDLLAAQFSKGTVWLEVKRKSKADWTHQTGRRETGIPLRLWNDYLDVQHETRLDVWVLFVHEQEDEVRGQRITYLNNGDCSHGKYGHQPTRRESRSDRMGRMVFFCWDCLKHIACTSDVLRLAAGDGAA